MKVLGEVCDWEVEKASLSLIDFSNLRLVGTTDVLKPLKSENYKRAIQDKSDPYIRKDQIFQLKQTETSGKEDPKQADEA